MAQTAFVFVNNVEFIEFPRPITSKVLYIGGIGVEEPNPLPKVKISLATSPEL